MGSAPLGVGAPPVMRTNGSTLCGAKPPTLTGPPMSLLERSRARVSAQRMTSPTGCPSAADGHRRAPLAGDGDRVKLVAVGARLLDHLARRLEQPGPPLGGVLGRGPVEPHVEVHGAHRDAQHVALERHHRDLGPPVAEVDRRGSSARPCQAAGEPGATSCIASRTLTMTVLTIMLPCGVPPKPYTAPDLAGCPLCSVA